MCIAPSSHPLITLPTPICVRNALFLEFKEIIDKCETKMMERQTDLY